ncbi:MAG TPA: acyltransferase [Chitinophagaceae bacterium]|nr:acyltransferase [Chitinophagaceae bacterium]
MPKANRYNPVYLVSVTLDDVLRRSRLPWIDYLKGIAIFLVVYRHALLGIQRSGIYTYPILEQLNMIFYSFRMPLFFILSGLFISKSLSKNTVPELIEKKTNSILYPYFVWAFIQISLQIIFSSVTNASRSAADYTYIFYHPRMLDQFWYLPALFNVSVAYMFTKGVLRVPAAWQPVIGIVLYFCSPYIRDISMISDMMEFYLFFSIGDITSRFFFSPKTQETLKKVPLLIVTGIVFGITQWLYLKQPEYYYRDTVPGQLLFLFIALIGCFSMILVAFRLQALNILKVLRIPGYYSIYIYLTHVLIIALTRIVLTKFFHIENGLLVLVIAIFSGIIIPIILYRVLSHNKIGQYLYTYRPEKKGKPPALSTPAAS